MALEFTKASKFIDDEEYADNTVLEMCFEGEFENIHLTPEQANITVPDPMDYLSDRQVILREVGDPYGPDILKIVYTISSELPEDIRMVSKALKYNGGLPSVYDKSTADPHSDYNCIYKISSDYKEFEIEGQDLIWRCLVNKSYAPVTKSFSCFFAYIDAEDKDLEYSALIDEGLTNSILIEPIALGDEGATIVKPIPPFPTFRQGSLVSWNIYANIHAVEKFRHYSLTVYNADGSYRRAEDFNLSAPGETELRFSFTWPEPLFGGNYYDRRTFRFIPQVETEYRDDMSLQNYYHLDQFVQPKNKKTYIWNGSFFDDAAPNSPDGVYWVYEHNLLNGTSAQVQYNLKF